METSCGSALQNEVTLEASFRDANVDSDGDESFSRHQAPFTLIAVS